MKSISFKKQHFLLVSIVVLCLIFTSCNKDELLNKSPITSLNSTNALVTEADYTALTSACYDPIQWQVINGAQTHILPVMFQDIRADNCLSQWASYWTYGAVFDDLRLIESNNTNIAALWQKWFTAVARANAAMHSDSSFKGFVTDGLQARLIAEAKFVRAFAYFQLVISFGDVPLITSYISTTSTNVIYPRTPAAAVYAQIENDLLAAAKALPLSYTGADVGRATSGGAYALLAKASLYQKKYADTRKYCEMVMSSGKYSLMPNFADNFSQDHEYNSEAIFQIGYISGIFNKPFESAEATQNQGSASYQMFGCIPAGTGGFGNCVPRQGLIDLYNNTDTRKDATFIVPTTYLNDLGMTAYDAGTQYYHYYWTNPDALISQASVRKFYIPKSTALSLTNLGSDGLNENILRYSDVLLMHAEASAMGAGGDGLGSLNEVIQRAYGGNPSHNLTSFTLADVKLQRRLELATEGWDRFTDLVRWGDAATALAFKHFKVGRDEVLPIPQGEIDLVGAGILLQNPGY